MVALCLAALAPDRFARVAPLCATDAASPWVVAFNHVARQTVLADPGWPEDASRGLELARQLAMITYRAERGFDLTQGRRLVGGDGHATPDWRAPHPYRIQTYLEHQGAKLRARFDARAYLCLLGAIDHHDLGRAPPSFTAAPAGESWGLSRIRASALGVDVDTDQLYLPAQTERWTAALGARGLPVERVTVQSPHGHDAFLIEWDQLRPVVARALSLPLARDARATTATSSPIQPESSQ
jgi:homoserine O-acetyltransferase